MHPVCCVSNLMRPTASDTFQAHCSCFLHTVAACCLFVHSVLFLHSLQLLLHTIAAVCCALLHARLAWWDMCWLSGVLTNAGSGPSGGKTKMGINTCRELFSLTGGVCRFASHLVSWPKLLFNQVSPPPTLGKGVRECKQWYPSSTRYPGLCLTTRELGEYWPTPFSNMIEEVSEVNSRKGGSLTPGRSQKPCVAGPGCGREGGLSYTEARVTNLSYACGRTKDGRTC